MTTGAIGRTAGRVGAMPPIGRADRKPPVPPTAAPFEEQLKKWQGETKFWGEQLAARESEVRQLRFQQTTKAAVHPVPRIWGEFVEFTGAALKGTPIMPRDTESQEVQLALEARDEAQRSMRTAMFFDVLYTTAPLLANAGQLGDLSQFIETMLSTSEYNFDPEKVLTPQQLQEAAETIRGMAEEGLQAKVDDRVPAWVTDITPEEITAVEKIFEPLVITPKPMHIVTIEEVVRNLTQSLMPTMPAGMDDEEMLRILSLMDIPADTLTETADLMEVVGQYSAAALDQMAKIDAVLAGEDEWEIPSMSIAEQAKFMFLSPMQMYADVLQPYLTNVSYPLSGIASYIVQRLTPGTGFMESRVSELTAEGVNPWSAMGQAWEEFDLHWAAKLAIEIFTDPITYTPGLLIKVPGKILVKVGFNSLGNNVLKFNTSMWRVLDWPFDKFKAIQASNKIRLPSQLVKIEIDRFDDLVIASTGKTINQLTPEHLTKTLNAAVKAAKQARITDPEDKLVALGRALLTPEPLSPERILALSKAMGGKLTAENLDLVVDPVNNIFRDVVSGVTVNPQEAAKRLALELGITDDTPKLLARLTGEMDSYISKFSNRIDKVIRIGETATVKPTLRMLEMLVQQQSKILKASLVTSTYAQTRELHGLVAAFMVKIDTLDRARWKLTMNRYFIRPVAEAYLGNWSYLIGNVMEGLTVSLLEGVMPRTTTAEEFFMAFRGMIGIDPAIKDAHIYSKLAGDPSQMLREGASILPGLLPEAIFNKKIPSWLRMTPTFLAKKPIEYSDRVGTWIRTNFLTQKYYHRVSEFARDIGGVDVIAELNRLITLPPVTIKGAIGRKLTAHALRQEMFHRSIVGKEAVLEMKELLSASRLGEAELSSIVRAAEYVTPRARANALQKITEGQVLDSTDTVQAFVKSMLDDSIDDILQYPFKIPNEFRNLADEIATLQIKNPEELMEIFQVFEIMTRTVNELPHKMMSAVMDEAGQLIEKGKFGTIPSLWKTNRADMVASIEEIGQHIESVRLKILNNTHLLDADVRSSLERIINNATDSQAIRKFTLDRDGEILDNFWSLSRAKRAEVDPATGVSGYQSLRAARDELWAGFETRKAVLFGRDYWEVQDYAALYRKIKPSQPKGGLRGFNIIGKPMSPQHIANILGVNMDGLVSGLLEVMTVQSRENFVQLVKQGVARFPRKFKGVTEEKISQVYDDILRGVGFTPDQDIAVQKIMQQLEGVRQELHSLRMVRTLGPLEERQLTAWIEGVAKGLDGVIGDKGIVSRKSWEAMRQSASDAAHRDYYRTFADYTNKNVISTLGRMIFPFFTYHTYRWFFLSAQQLRHPGVGAAWGKYYNYSDYGYVHIPGTDLDLNPFVGSVAGATFGLARHDFKSYYEDVPGGEGLDAMQRRGFFPGPQIMFPIVGFAALYTGEQPQFGDLLPPIARMSLNLLIASEVPGVSDSAQWLQDKIFHDNFRDYYTATIVSDKQSRAGGVLIDGQSGIDLWHKIQRKEGLSEAEQELWDEASKLTGWYNALRSQLPQFRLREEEMTEAYLVVSKIFESYFGMTEEYQRYLWKHNMRPADEVGGIPLDLRLKLNEMWQWKIWFGRGQILMPPSISNLYGLMNKYSAEIKRSSDLRNATQLTTDRGFLNPTATLHFDGKEWKNEYISAWTEHITRIEQLESDPQYKDAIDAMTPEGQVRLAKELGFFSRVIHPIDEVIDLYLTIELEEKPDPVTRVLEWDFDGFWAKREAVRMALTEEQRTEFDNWLHKNQTEVEQLWRDVNNRYLRGYRSVTRIVFDDYADDLKSLIKEYYADDTSLTRKEAIRDTQGETGRKLLSEYEGRLTDARLKLRLLSPQLDAWLYVFGYTSTLKTPEARILVDSFDRDRKVIFQWI